MRLSSTSVIFLFISVLSFNCKEKNTSTSKPATTDSQTASKETAISINLDKSPLDLSYYPADYPVAKMSGNAKEAIVTRLLYSRPKKDGRVIFGNVVKYGSRWRLGANEASEIEFFKDVTIQNTTVQKNRYVIYCIPRQNTWTIILNTDLFTWGLKIDSTKDLHKFEIPVSKTQYAYEYLSMEFEKADTGMHLVMTWDTVKAILPIRY